MKTSSETGPPASASFASADADSSRPDGKKRLTVVIAGGLFNVSTATCGEICQFCDGYSNLELVPGPFYGTYNSSWSLIAQATDAYGSKQTLSGGTWSSGTPSVITVNSSTGLAQGVGVGQSTISDFLQIINVYQGEFCVNENMNDSCPTANETPQTTGTVQVPTSLSIVPGTDSTTSEAPCTTSGGLAGCGVTRKFTYQVNDQNGNPITVANMAIGDVICSTSTNQLNVQGYKTTCGGTTGSCSGTAGPCGQFTDANGQFAETLTLCAPACKSSGTCTTAGQTIANQTWTVAGQSLSSDVKSISYQCNKILVNGK